MTDRSLSSEWYLSHRHTLGSFVMLFFAFGVIVWLAVMAFVLIEGRRIRRVRLEHIDIESPVAHHTRSRDKHSSID